MACNSYNISNENVFTRFYDYVSNNRNITDCYISSLDKSHCNLVLTMGFNIYFYHLDKVKTNDYVKLIVSICNNEKEIFLKTYINCIYNKDMTSLINPVLDDKTGKVDELI